MFGYTKVEVESDSLLAVQLTEAEDIGGHPFEVLIRDIHLFANSMEGCKVRHIKREANFVVDFMAKFGHYETVGERWLAHTPTAVQNLLEADRIGTQISTKKQSGN
ncbi:hypothetical protein LINGRAHAP2_LOCUS32837 [Linum grandiflorum]